MDFFSLLKYGTFFACVITNVAHPMLISQRPLRFSESTSYKELREFRNTLATSKSEQDDSEEHCAICLMPLMSEKAVTELCNCNHIFHTYCLEKCRENRHRTVCPLCRTVIGHISPWVAARDGDIDLLKRIERNGCNILEAEEGGPFPLFEAVKCGHLHVVKFLIERSASIDQTSNSPRRPLQMRIVGNSFNQLDVLIIQGTGDMIPINSLRRAVEARHTDIVGFLAYHGANVNHIDEDGSFPLILAVFNEDYATVECLLEHGALASQAIPNNGLTSLHVAVLKQNRLIVTCLLAHGADSLLGDNYGLSAKSLANRLGHPEIIQLFYQHDVARMQNLFSEACLLQ